MTAAEKLVALAKSTGAAASLLLLIGSGQTTGAALVDYSGLTSATAAEHLLVEHVVSSADTPKAYATTERKSVFVRLDANLAIALSERFSGCVTTVQLNVISAAPNLQSISRT